MIHGRFLFLLQIGVGDSLVGEFETLCSSESDCCGSGKVLVQRARFS